MDHKFRSTFAPGGPNIPASWTVPDWYVDAANVTGCATDNNSGTSASCGTGGAGPLASWHEVVSRGAGAQGAQLQQTTIFHLLSDLPVSDPIVFDPYPVRAASAWVEGVLGATQTVGTCALSSVTAKNRATNQLLQATATCATAVGQLLVNSTHPSEAWVYQSLGSSAWVVTQPMAPSAAPATFGFAEVNTWANGDVITAYNEVNVTIPSLSGLNVQGSSIGLSHIQTDQSIFSGRIITGGAYPIEFTVSMPYGPNFWASSLCLNCTTLTPHSSGGLAVMTGNMRFVHDQYVNGLTWLGGALIQDEFTGEIDNDTIVYEQSTGAGLITANMGAVYVAANNLSVFQGSLIGPNVSFSNVGQIWGPGTLTIRETVRYVAPAATRFTLAGGLQVGTSATACASNSSTPATINCGISLTAANLDAAFGSGGFGGNAFISGVGSLTSSP